MSERLALVVAMGANRVIGRDGGMPWHLPEDLRHFRRVTMGHAIIMGRKTHESIGRALPGRTNIVLTRDQGAEFEGCRVAHSLESAIQMARDTGDEAPRVVGGGAIYTLALPLASTLFLSEVAGDFQGDTFFPSIDPDQWIEVDRRDGEAVVYRTLERR
jgi:dihydrofolate reductase